MAIHLATIWSYDDAEWKNIQLVLEFPIIAMSTWSHEQNSGIQ